MERPDRQDRPGPCRRRAYRWPSPRHVLARQRHTWRPTTGVRQRRRGACAGGAATRRETSDADCRGAARPPRARYRHLRLVSGAMSGQPRPEKVTSEKVTVQAALIAAPQCGPLVPCGLDEVGRGALAGPLVAAGVLLPPDLAERPGPAVRFLRESKTVARRGREKLAEAILRPAALAEGEGW